MAEADGRLARLRLIRTPHVGPVTYRQLLQRFGTAEAALAALPALAARGGQPLTEIASVDAAARELARIDALGAGTLFLDDPGYPAALQAIDTAPPLLIWQGDRALLARRTVAMVGARNASAAACRFARGLAADLGAAGIAIVSGLAHGIDTAAHQGSIGTGTIAVIASGIDIAFPPENAELQQRIAAEGLLLAEQPPGTEPRARHFPYRNRIIAGLALGTVVVEAAPRSGSLITARLAAEMGRDVMAVPGSPLDPRAQGCNLLIREGAILVQSAADILEQIGPIDPRAVADPRRGYAADPPGGDASAAERAAILALLGPTPVPVDELVRQAGVPPGTVQLILLELELAGRLERHAGGRASLVSG